MKPPTNHTNHTPSPAHHGGFFITPTFPKKTRAELTTVNKCCTINYKSTSCKSTIFQTVKPAHAVVNIFAEIMQLDTNSNHKKSAYHSPAEPTSCSLSGHGPVPLKLKGRGSFSAPVPPMRGYFLFAGNKRSDSLRQLRNNNERNKRK